MNTVEVDSTGGLLQLAEYVPESKLNLWTSPIRKCTSDIALIFHHPEFAKDFQNYFDLSDLSSHQAEKRASDLILICLFVNILKRV